jgi:sugar phosphate permease
LAQESESELVYPVSKKGNGQQSPWFSPERPSHKWWVTVALMLGILIQGLNFGTVNVALPMLFPGALLWGFSNLIAGRLADQVNNRLLVSVALMMIAVAFYRFSHIDLWSTTTYILSLFMVQSFARGLLQSPWLNFLMAVLPKEKVIMGSGLPGLMNVMGSTFGVSMAAIALSSLVSLILTLFLR